MGATDSRDAVKMRAFCIWFMSLTIQNLCYNVLSVAPEWLSLADDLQAICKDCANRVSQCTSMSFRVHKGNMPSIWESRPGRYTAEVNFGAKRTSQTIARKNKVQCGPMVGQMAEEALAPDPSATDGRCRQGGMS